MVEHNSGPNQQMDQKQIRTGMYPDPGRMDPRWVWTDPEAFFDQDDREFYHDLLREQQEQM